MSKKILIIEDRRENIIFIANNILKPLGYDVITAMDGQTALAKAEEEMPDLIITDVKLPKMSGLEVLGKLRQKGLDIPAIVMTFHGTEDTAVQALRLGARDYLIKPFTVEDMQAALNRALKPASRANSQAIAKYEAKVAGLEQQLSETRAMLTEREEQLMRLATASKMAARVPRLEQELAKMRSALAERQEQLNQHSKNTETRARVVQLEQELIQMRRVLVNRENQLKQMQKYLANFANKQDLSEVAKQTTAWEAEKNRLNEALAKTRDMLNESQRRANILEEELMAQKTQMGKSRQEAQRLAAELRNLSEAVRLLSQDLVIQVERLEDLTPGKEKTKTGGFPLK